eukprot:10798848-Lingulodinium_polyedra.AAC.1
MLLVTRTLPSVRNEAGGAEQRQWMYDHRWSPACVACTILKLAFAPCWLGKGQPVIVVVDPWFADCCAADVAL